MIRFLLITIISISSCVSAKEEKNMILGTWKSCGDAIHTQKDGRQVRIGNGSTITFHKNGRYELFWLDGYTDLECKNLKFRSGFKSKGRYKVLEKTDIENEGGPVYRVKVTGWYGQKSCINNFVITGAFILPQDNLCTKENEKKARFRNEDWFKFYKAKKTKQPSSP